MNKLLLITLLLTPIIGISQSPREKLLSVLKNYERFDTYDYEFVYTALDINKDTFYLENKGELKSTNFRSKAYYRIGGLSVNILYSNKFIKRKQFFLKTDGNESSLFDVENDNISFFAKIKNQLLYSKFKINQFCLPLLMRDSSTFFNNRFFEFILREKPISDKDSLISRVDTDTVYSDIYLKFTISFKNFNKEKAFKKWEKYFDKNFIELLDKYRFIIILNKTDLQPIEYQIIKDNILFESYSKIKIKETGKKDYNIFSPYYRQTIQMEMYVRRVQEGFVFSTRADIQRYAEPFTEKDCINGKQIKFTDIKSEYILLFVWNSQSVDTSDSFLKLLNLAEKRPEKLSIIGLNNYNESKEYIQRIYDKYKWKFPTVNGREVCKKYYVSDALAYILIHNINGKYLVNKGYMVDYPKLIFYYCNKDNE